MFQAVSVILMSLMLGLSPSQPASLAEMTEDYAAVVASWPEVQSVTIGDDEDLMLVLANGTEANLYLGNLHAELSMAVSDKERAETWADFHAAIRQLSILEKFVPTRESLSQALMPAIRPRAYLDDVIDQYGDTVDPKCAQAVPFVRLTDNLVRVLLIDSSASAALVTCDTLADADVSADEVAEMAMQNMRDVVQEDLDIFEDNGVTMVAGNGFYESSLLLIDEHWRAVDAKTSGKPVAIPLARNILMYTDSSNQKAIELMMSIATDNVGTLSGAISSAPIIWDGGVWQPYYQ